MTFHARPWPGAARLVFILALAGLLAACAAPETRRAFERPAPNRFLPGVTPMAEVLAVYGAPAGSLAWDATGEAPGAVQSPPFGRQPVQGTMREINYLHIASNAPAARPGIEPARTLTFWFWQDRLVGYLGQSSFKADSTAFNEAQVNGLRAGTSTRRDLLRVLGQPAGILTHPLVRGEGNEVLIWDNAEFDRFLNDTRRKRLDVLVDAAGAVLDLRFSSSRTPVPAPAPTILAPPTYTPPPVIR